MKKKIKLKNNYCSSRFLVMKGKKDQRTFTHKTGARRRQHAHHGRPRTLETPQRQTTDRHCVFGKVLELAVRAM